MITIKETYDSLTSEQKRVLNYAFEYSISQHIELADGRYIGVHTDKIKNLKPESTSGAWAIGHIQKG